MFIISKFFISYAVFFIKCKFLRMISFFSSYELICLSKIFADNLVSPISAKIKEANNSFLISGLSLSGFTSTESFLNSIRLKPPKDDAY